MSFQQIQILGRVGQDCELRFTPTGIAVGSFSLASNESWTGNDGQKQERVTWHRCTLWGSTAEKVSEHITKGKALFVVGTVTANAYMDREGNAKASLEVKVNTFRFVGGRGDSAEQNTSTVDNPPLDKDVPF